MEICHEIFPGNPYEYFDMTFENPADFKRGDDIEKGIVKWLVEFFDETNELTGVATILTMVKKLQQ